MSTIIPIDKIRTDGGTQFRVKLNEATVNEYAEAMKEGAVFPDVIVFGDGGSVYWMADGFHRLAAATQAGTKEIAADVWAGTQRDAVLYSLSANSVHGLRRSNDDKRKAVMFAIRDPELRKQSQHQIAKLCGVTQAMVSKAWNEVYPKGSDNGYHYDTPEAVLAAMNADHRRALLKYMLNRDYLQDAIKKYFEQVGLITTYEYNRLEPTAMAQRIVDLLAGEDTWLKFELDLAAENQTRPQGQRVHVHEFDLCRKALEKLHAAAGWVDGENVGNSYDARQWLDMLAWKGYVQKHEVQVSQYTTYTYWHITAAGCKLLGLPYSLPVKEPPSQEEMRAEYKKREAQRREDEKRRDAEWEKQRQARIDPAKEAADERMYIQQHIKDLRKAVRQVKYLGSVEAQIEPLLRQITEIVKAAEVPAPKAAAQPVEEAEEVEAEYNPDVPVYKPGSETGWLKQLSSNGLLSVANKRSDWFALTWIQKWEAVRSAFCPDKANDPLLFIEVGGHLLTFDFVANAVGGTLGRECEMREVDTGKVALLRRVRLDGGGSYVPGLDRLRKAGCVGVTFYHCVEVEASAFMKQWFGVEAGAMEAEGV